jgi:hypothetical protein
MDNGSKGIGMGINEKLAILIAVNIRIIKE